MPDKAVLFATCFVNYNNPDLGRDVVDVFSRNGISLGCPEQNCCGMPALEAGDLELARKMAISNVARFILMSAPERKSWPSIPPALT